MNKNDRACTIVSGCQSKHTLFQCITSLSYAHARTQRYKKAMWARLAVSQNYTLWQSVRADQLWLPPSWHRMYTYQWLCDNIRISILVNQECIFDGIKGIIIYHRSLILLSYSLFYFLFSWEKNGKRKRFSKKGLKHILAYKK